MSAIRVVVVDDHPVVRSGLRHVLESDPDLALVGEASTGEEALRLVANRAPDVLILDIRMPGMSGLDVAHRLRADGTPVAILALSMYENQDYVQSLLRAGALGYLTKDQAPELIAEAVHAVANGEVWWFVRPVSPDDFDGDAAVLTKRERDVLVCLAHGYSNADIADRLHISENTVRTHTSSLYSKLEVSSAREAIAWAWQSGFMHTGGAANHVRETNEL
jgi:DNA-binding NarL/FixJ family response regulator